MPPLYQGPDPLGLGGLERPAHEAGQVVNDVIPGTPAAAAEDVDGPLDPQFGGQVVDATSQTAGSTVGTVTGGVAKGALASGPTGWLGYAIIGLIIYGVILR